MSYRTKWFIQAVLIFIPSLIFVVLLPKIWSVIMASASTSMFEHSSMSSYVSALIVNDIHVVSLLGLLTLVLIGVLLIAYYQGTKMRISALQSQTSHHASLHGGAFHNTEKRARQSLQRLMKIELLFFPIGFVIAVLYYFLS